MKIRRLLAKSSATPLEPLPYETLTGHAEAVLSAGDVLCRILAEDMQRFLGSGELWQSFRQVFRTACWFHDVGKANDHFQMAVRKRLEKQGLRHDTFGFFILSSHLQDWLQPLFAEDWQKKAFLISVAGHHLKFPDPDRNRPGSQIQFLASHSDFSQLLNFGSKHFNLKAPPVLDNPKDSLVGIGGLRSKILKQYKYCADMPLKDYQQKYIAALKSSLLCADLAGSAIPKKTAMAGNGYESWIESRLSKTLQRSELKSIVSKKLGGAHPLPFQELIRSAKTITVLVEAGCGAGKTAAAYLWASEKAEGRRLFFTYPTTATASEGFSGYMQDPDFDAILINSRAAVDYRLMPNMPPRSKEEKELRQMGLEALETWPIPAVVCTAHTVLGILQNTRRGLYAWPSLVRSTFVFDEIHSYSPRLFAHLLRFLKEFPQAPALLMTATFPPAKRKLLEDVCRIRGGLEVIHGPEKREQALRYIIKKADTVSAWESVRSALTDGKKSLWVVNTVARAMTLLRESQEMGLVAEAFHSRYRYRDRIARQRAVIDGFGPDRPPFLAITTQVAEMSLDLSADLLVSEWAPVASIIQRMGRLNRFAEVPEAARLALMVKPENALPYAKADEEEQFFNCVEKWLNAVCDGKPKSQKDLGEAFIALDDFKSDAEELTCDWIDMPWKSESNRQGLMEPGYTIDLIREEDLGKGSPDELAIPMPIRGTKFMQWNRKGRFFVAPAGRIIYDNREGAQWNEYRHTDDTII